MNIGVRNNQLHSDVSKFFKYRIRDKKWFQTFIIMVIFVAGILVGVQTYDIQDQDYLDVIGYVRPRSWGHWRHMAHALFASAWIPPLQRHVNT